MCFLQFPCTNLDGSQKEGNNFLNLLQKEGGTQKGGGFPQKRWGSKPGGNYGHLVERSYEIASVSMSVG